MLVLNRRDLLRTASLTAAAGVSALPLATSWGDVRIQPNINMSFGLVTYQWGRDWDLPTLIRHCDACDVHGVELRTTHAHKVEPALNAAQRKDVQRRFADSRVSLVGIGSNERFDNPDPAVLKEAINKTKAFIELSHDVGGTGVKVKPDRFHKDVPHEKTVEQIGRSLNELGQYGEGYGQQIRLEVHGQCAELPTIKAIMDVADHHNVAVCWNSNQQDLEGAGLKANFEMVRRRLGHTVHVRELDSDYPYPDLFKLLVDSDYHGWILLEAHSIPQDSQQRVDKLKQQHAKFKQLLAKAAE